MVSPVYRTEAFSCATTRFVPELFPRKLGLELEKTALTG
jgi:hypothetical protein